MARQYYLVHSYDMPIEMSRWELHRLENFDDCNTVHTCRFR